MSCLSPNMIPEIIEAIHLMYEDEPEIEVDCLLCLSNLRGNLELSGKLADASEMKLEDMGRCSYCGEILQLHHYKEPHPELDGYPMEDMTELYCPNCDIGGDRF